MALKFKLDSLDGLEEGLKSLYSKGDDGKFTLQLEDDPAKATMQKLRQELAEKEKALKDREKAEADAKTAKEREDDERKGNFEKLKLSLEADKAQLAKDLQEARTTHENHLKETKALTLLGPIAATAKTLEALKSDFMSHLEIVEGKLLVKGDPGMTPEKLAESFQKNPEYAPFLKGTGASGGGAGQSSGTAGNTGDNAKKSGTELIREGLDAGLLKTI